MLLLVPSDPLRPRRADGHFLPEAEAARDLGVPVCLVDHDALVRGRPDEALRGVPAGEDVVYRGWMLRSDQYAVLAALLEQRGATLRTTPAQYARAHELPGWIDALADVTPVSVWTYGPELEKFDAACARLGSGPAVLRDYVKSLKHCWHEAAFIPDVADTAAARSVAQRFLDLREDDFTGGFVLRRFEKFTSVEARTWWADGRCALVTAHPDTPDEAVPAPLLDGVASIVEQLGLPFVTVDLVLRDDGAWRVVELGDGQVSDRPSSTPAADLLRLLCPTSP